MTSSSKPNEEEETAVTCDTSSTNASPSSSHKTENGGGLFEGLEMNQRNIEEEQKGEPQDPKNEKDIDDNRKLNSEEEAAFELAQDEIVECPLPNKSRLRSRTLSKSVLNHPILNTSSLFRLIRKFISKTSVQLPTSPDAAKEGGILSYFFSSSSQVDASNLKDKCLEKYFELCALIKEEELDARKIITSFANLVAVWCQSNSNSSEPENNQAVITNHLLSLAINTTESLVAHSCFDNVYIIYEKSPAKAISIITNAILTVDLSSEETELSVLKFLLTTGCHTTSSNEAMLRGTALLQTIRVCYHVYLKTASEPNKTTARAALQQLVTSVFQRMQNTIPVPHNNEAVTIYKEVQDHYSLPIKSDRFLSSNHRDAFLVLRSLCKLSMKTLPEKDPDKDVAALPVGLDSKILALELLLYVLQHTDGAAYLNAGTQFLFAIRNYLCVSLLTNCTSSNTQVVELSLRLFVPLLKHFKSYLKTEIEAFVTNVFFVILDSTNSAIEHKTLVVTLFSQICADKNTLAEIFLNYDCDMSAVDLFDRIVNTLAKVARIEEDESNILTSGHRLVLERKNNIRKLRLEAMRALRQILASLHSSTVIDIVSANSENATVEKEKSFVEMYDTKKKLRTEQMEVVLRFNVKPSHGLAYADKCGHLDISDPSDVARFLLEYKDKLDKTQVGEYLGKEADYKDGFCLQVLHCYVDRLDLSKMRFDDAIRFYLSGFRLPGEAQKIDRIMEKFAERYCLLNPEVFPTADVAFILAFSIIMLNTDLHNPAIKEERRMTKESFIRNNRGICDGGDLPDSLLIEIFERIQKDPISLKEDDEARERVQGINVANNAGIYSAVFPSSHFYEIEKGREYAFLKERDHIVRTTESLFKRNTKREKSKPKSSSGSSKSKKDKKFVMVETGIRDQYVIPMFEVTWGPALAVFSYAMEASKRELQNLDLNEDEADIVEESNNVSLDICLSSFRLAICTAGLCGNFIARDAFAHALYNFTQLGTGRLLLHRNVRCLLLLLKLGKEDGELLGNTWEYIFKALSIVARLRSVHDTMLRNDRVNNDQDIYSTTASSIGSEFENSTDSSEFDDEDIFLEEEMDRRAVDEANARIIDDYVPEGIFETIYAKSISLSSTAAKEFVLQLCRVSRMEISGYGGHVGSRANEVDVESTRNSTHQPVIYSLQKLVEVTHYNMDSRSRLVFAEMWTTISGHLTSTALHSNAAVAMYAVDSFRQLSIQFLEREELGMFEFQKRFLKPFETVMSRSHHVSIKELLLNCMEQIILLFGNISVTDNTFKPKKNKDKYRGTLRSGWKPVLAVLGIAGQDKAEAIIKAGFKLLNTQVEQALNSQEALHHAPKNVQVSCSLLTEHFVDLVEAIVMYFGCRIETLSLIAIEHVIALTDWLVDDSIPLPHVRRRVNHEGEGKNNPIIALELELWWPILLGLSRSIGDNRRAVREKSFHTLLDLINSQFFPSSRSIEENGQVPASIASSQCENELQTLQLVFKGVLTATLEHAETDFSTGGKPANPPLPEDFSYFFTHPPPPSSRRAKDTMEVMVNDADASEGSTWLDTTYDSLMDACVSICLRSMQIHKSDALVEEILAMLNSCLLSENGALAVRGLMRLQQFITQDMNVHEVTENTWAVVCHMLKRCLTVRGLSTVVAAIERAKEPAVGNGIHHDDAASVVAAGLHEQRAEDLSYIQEFIQEEEFFSVRRYVASMAIRVIGDLLTSEEYSKALGMRWFLFLVTGLGSAIQEWESAADVLDFYHSTNEGESIIQNVPQVGFSPPHYLENALYGRTRMVKFILLLVDKEDILKDVGVGEMSSVQILLKDQTDSIIQAYLEKESTLAEANQTGEEKTSTNKIHHLSYECLAGELSHFTTLVCELLDGYNSFDDSKLASLIWLCPLLSNLIESNNKSVRSVVHDLVSRMFEGPFKNGSGDGHALAADIISKS